MPLQPGSEEAHLKRVCGLCFALLSTSFLASTASLARCGCVGGSLLLFFFKRREGLFVFFLLLLRFGWDAVEGLDCSLSLLELSGCLSDLISLFLLLVNLFLLSYLCFTSVWFVLIWFGCSCLRSVILLWSILDLLTTKDFLILWIGKGFALSISSIESLCSLWLLSSCTWSSSLRPLTCHFCRLQRSEGISTSFEIWEIFFISNIHLVSVVSSSE